MFLSDDAAAAEPLVKGLAEATFSSPSGYSAVVRLKRMAYVDATLGVDDYVRGQTVLDVGCGPSLDLPHMENGHRLAVTYTGIDPSAPFVLSARRENPSERYRFAQASITDLPFPDKSFDTSIVSFTIHHVDDPDHAMMRELLRVTRSHIVIFDHLRADNRLLQRIQDTYWRLFDGGCNYMRWGEWEGFLKGATVVRKLQTGAIFGHVVKLVCTVD
jgi:SAM-dependent methyltransferase